MKEARWDGRDSPWGFSWTVQLPVQAPSAHLCLCFQENTRRLSSDTPAVCVLLDRVFESICRPLKVLLCSVRSGMG